MLHGDSDGGDLDMTLGVRRMHVGTVRECVSVHRAPDVIMLADALARVMLSGHGFGVRVVDAATRTVEFGTAGEGIGVVRYVLGAEKMRRVLGRRLKRWTA